MLEVSCRCLTGIAPQANSMAWAVPGASSSALPSSPWTWLMGAGLSNSDLRRGGGAGGGLWATVHMCARTHNTCAKHVNLEAGVCPCSRWPPAHPRLLSSSPVAGHEGTQPVHTGMCVCSRPPALPSPGACQHPLPHWRCEPAHTCVRTCIQMWSPDVSSWRR